MSWFDQRAGLDGTVAVVTGGAGGRGEPISRDLAANRVTVAAIDIARTLAAELAPEGIRVNNVAPDFVPAQNSNRIGSADAPLSTRLGVSIGIPMARPGRVTEVSSCVLSGRSAYIAGTTLHPDGGTQASSGWFNWPGSGWGNNVPGAVLCLLPQE